MADQRQARRGGRALSPLWRQAEVTPYRLIDAPDGWWLVEVGTGEVVDWFGDFPLAVQTLHEQNEEL
jgi:hypothetical protein